MRLADFGLACVLASSAASCSSSRAGTATYFAPEQARGRHYGRKVSAAPRRHTPNSSNSSNAADWLADRASDECVPSFG